MLGNTLGTTKIQCFHPPPKQNQNKKKKEAWMPWVDVTSPHWQQELFCIIVFFAIFCQGKAMNYMGCT
jgi:hypothetical protein